MPLCLKVCKLGCGSIEAPSRGEPKPGPLGPDFYLFLAAILGLWMGLTETGESVKFAITAETRVGDILTRWPQTLDILVNNGFQPLADPEHREKVKGLPVTLGMACERHGLDIDLLTSLLNKAAASIESEKMSSQNETIPLKSIQGKLRQGDVIGQQHVIGDILRVYPATEKVFTKYYGAACFSCPGQATESVRQSAMMHNVEEKKILKELNGAAGH